MSLVDRMKHGVDVTKFKADQVLRVRRVESEINELRRQISDVRAQIASTTLALYDQAALQNPELQKLCRAIDDLKAQIATKESLIEAIRAEEAPISPQISYQPVNPCPKCYAEIPPGTTFCTNCGYRLPQELSREQGQIQPGNTCPNCNSILETGAKFCTTCGYKFPTTN